MSTARLANEKRPVRYSPVCTNCRERHLKCDGGPMCSRCKNEGNNCLFTPSRRGMRPDRRSTTEASSSATPTQWMPVQLTTNFTPNYWNPPTEALEPPLTGPANVPLYPALPAQPANSAFKGQPAVATSHSRHLFDLFFTYFFHSHPFVLPREYLSEALIKRGLYHLEAVIEYIGSCYDPSLDRNQYRDQAEIVLFVQQCPQDGFTVQALLLFAIGLYANNELQRAEHVLNRARDLALALGMNHRNFAAQFSAGSLVQEESWKRTWWDLYVVERVFAATCRPWNYKPNAVPCNVALPCEEDDYRSGHVSRIRTLEEFDRCAINDSKEVFSSYAYRIEAARILTSILPLERTPYLDVKQNDSITQRLSALCLFFSNCTKYMVLDGGRCDEMLFQAHLLAYMAAMIFHRSNPSNTVEHLSLAISQFQPPNPTNTQAFFGSTISQLYKSVPDFHTTRSSSAADNVAKLATVPCPTILHTPFMVSCLVIGAAIHLSAWGLLTSEYHSYTPERSFPTSETSSSLRRASTTSESYIGSTVPSSHSISTYSSPTSTEASTFGPSRLSVAGPSFLPSGYVPYEQSSGVPADPTRLGKLQLREQIRVQVGALKNLCHSWPVAKAGLGDLVQIRRQVLTKVNRMTVTDLIDTSEPTSTFNLAAKGLDEQLAVVTDQDISAFMGWTSQPESEAYAFPAEPVGTMDAPPPPPNRDDIAYAQSHWGIDGL